MIPCAPFAVMCGDPDGARREAQLPDYTPSGPPLSVPVRAYRFADALAVGWRPPVLLTLVSLPGRLVV